MVTGAVGTSFGLGFEPITAFQRAWVTSVVPMAKPSRSTWCSDGVRKRPMSRVSPMENVPAFTGAKVKVTSFTVNVYKESAPIQGERSTGPETSPPPPQETANTRAAAHNTIFFISSNNSG